MDLEKALQKYSQVYVTGSMGLEAPKIFAKRRNAHLRKLDQILVISGVEREPGAENIWMMNGLRLFQEPALMYLTGINQTHVRMVLNPFRTGKDRFLLFLPSKNPDREFWDGVRLGRPLQNEKKADFKELSQLLGTSRIYHTSDFYKVLAEEMQFSKQQSLHCFYHEYLDPKTQKLKRVKTDHNFLFKTELQKNLQKSLGQKIKVSSWAQEHYALRLIQDEFQVADAKKAQEYTLMGFKELIKDFKNLKTENEVAATLEYHMKKRSEFGLAFPSIIASGKNACTLHYLKNDEALDKTGLLLMDFGVRYGTQHADITRTIPVNGKYNPLQKLLYDIVLEAQILNEDFIKPGVLLEEANEKVWDYIEEQLEKRFFAKGGVAKREYVRKPHGVSHLMGEQEHDGDPFRIYSQLPLKEGMMISNEPGLYGWFEMKIGRKTYSEWIGIRIEDDLLVTRNGCENLSKDFPRTPEEIEQLILKKK